MKRILAFLLAAALMLGLLTGCQEQETEAPSTAPSEAVETLPAATVPADGDPNDVTCKGSYSGSADTMKVVARAGDGELTNGLLQVFYWAEAAAYRKSGQEPAPDFARPLDTQACPIDDSVASWQQYFLKRALNAWHSAQALVQQAAEVPRPTEAAYQPVAEKHAEMMTGMPAAKILYGYNPSNAPNSMHQAYLDNIPAMLETLALEKGFADAGAMAGEAFGATTENLNAYAQLLNRGYMYFTTLSYDIPTEALPEAQSDERYVDFRQVLVYPKHPDNPWRREAVEEAVIGPNGRVSASEELWTVGQGEAQKILDKWKHDRFSGEATFAELARKTSADAGSAVDGGLYRQVKQGQLPEALEAWCFDPARKAGDTAVIRTEFGLHLVYFVRSTDISAETAWEAALAGAQADLITDARERYPMEVDYASIALGEGSGTVGAEEILYPDVAHERYPEVPLYLQQDYPDTMYGDYPIRSHGCGITTMAMLASYMTDTELTPPEMCERYGRYSHKNGTDGMMFNRVPAELGFYLREKTYDPKVAKQALEDGYILVVVQTKGFWTRGGHYLLLEKMNEDGRIQVRDSNLLNYGRLEDHKIDSFEWSTIPKDCKGYWIFENKIKTVPACVRCGNPEELPQGLSPEGYICGKCENAMLRRNAYLTGIEA